MATDSDDEGTDLVELSVVTVSALTLVLAFGLMAAGWSSFWILFPIGFGAGVPLAAAWAKWYQRRRSDREAPADDPVERLRERYASGEIDEAEFERRLDGLLRTEDADIPDGTVLEDRTDEPEYERDYE